MLRPPAGSSSNTKCVQSSHPKTTDVLKVQRLLPAQEPRPGLEVRPGGHIVTSSPNESGTGQLPEAGAGVRAAHGAEGSQRGRGGRLHAVSRHSEGPGGLGVRTGPGMGSEADAAAPAERPASRRVRSAHRCFQSSGSVARRASSKFRNKQM